ncbi:4230_t:CDS:2, partial [Diversispora eburnea]
MKNLLTFALFVILINNFAFALSNPNKLKRGLTFLDEDQTNLTTCSDSSYYLCSNGVGCCPIGSTCIDGNKTTSIRTTSIRTTSIRTTSIRTTTTPTKPKITGSSSSTSKTNIQGPPSFTPIKSKGGKQATFDSFEWKRQSTCDTGYYLCTGTTFCCPIGVECLIEQKACDIACVATDEFCSNGNCCKPGTHCGSDDLCYKDTTTLDEATTDTPVATTG